MTIPTQLEAILAEREACARIIDPEVFELIEHYSTLGAAWGDPRDEDGTFKAYPQLRERRDTAYTKADQILALTTPTGMDETQARELLAFTMASRGCKPENVEAVRHACNGHIVKVSADLAVAAIQAALSKGSVRQ